MIKMLMVLFVESVNNPLYISSTQHTGGVWVSQPFRNWKNATEKMKAHEKSGLHCKAVQAVLLTSQQGSVVQQLERVSAASKRTG